jgi:hypothetical protein
MDSKGIYMINFIFSIFIILIIFIISLNLIESNLSDETLVEVDLNSRLLLDEIGNSINSVSSKNLGNIKKITLPKNISSVGYYILVKKTEIIISFRSKKGETVIKPIKLANSKGKIINELSLYPGETYKIKKSLNEDNITVIQIYNI